MMTKELPIQLNKDPLLEALFEVRFTSAFPASTVLPGLLFSKLEGDKRIEQLAVAQIPLAIRDADPHLRFAPISRLIWKQFHINIGDNNVSIACQSPKYPGWLAFKEAINEILNILIEIHIVESVQRYSIKYINLIPSESLEEQVSFINFNVTLANHRLTNEAFQLRLEVNEGQLVNVISIMSSAEIVLPDDSVRKGVIVDIDTIAILNDVSLETLVGRFDDTRKVNKIKFFDCLTQKTIESLEPIYE